MNNSERKECKKSANMFKCLPILYNFKQEDYNFQLNCFTSSIACSNVITALLSNTLLASP